MYVYGGVTLHVNNTRVPADSEPGLLHAFDFATYTWSTIRTTGTESSIGGQPAAGVAFSGDISTIFAKASLPNQPHTGPPSHLLCQAAHTVCCPGFPVCCFLSGDHRPCSTTLLAFFWHAGSLYAIPDLPRVDQGGSHKASKMAAAGYQLLCLTMDSKQWQLVTCQVCVVAGAKGRGLFNPTSSPVDCHDCVCQTL